jgi:hypothetical protein
MFGSLRNAFKKMLLLLAGGALLSSCIHEDYEGCEFPVRLRFTYTYNVEGKDLFDPEISVIDLFVYDSETGVLKERKHILSESLDADNSCSLMLPKGKYKLVVWGGVEERYDYSSTEKLPDALMSIKRESDGRTVAQKREHAFCKMEDEINVIGERQPERVIDLHKLSNDIRVEVGGLSESLRARVSCTISSSNGDYSFDGSCMPSGSVLYLPARGDSNGDAVFSFTTLSLWEGDDSHLTVRIEPQEGSYYKDGVTIYDGSLTDLLLKRDGTDLDLQDEFVIRFEPQISPEGKLVITVYVDEWIVANMDEGLV